MILWRQCAKLHELENWLLRKCNLVCNVWRADVKVQSSIDQIPPVQRLTIRHNLTTVNMTSSPPPCSQGITMFLLIVISKILVHLHHYDHLCMTIITHQCSSSWLQRKKLRDAEREKCPKVFICFDDKIFFFFSEFHCLLKHRTILYTLHTDQRSKRI